MFNPVAPYRYLLPNLSVADIANQDLFACVVGPGLVSTSPAFMRSIPKPSQRGRMDGLSQKR